MNLIKLGGSVITDKTSKDSFSHDVMDRVSSEINRSKKRTVLIHGAGSFGHILADKYRLHKGYLNDEKQKKGVSLTSYNVQKLNNLVLNSLIKNDVNAISIPTHVVLKLKDGCPLDINFDVFKGFLKKGFVPVGYGDVVLDEDKMFSICSGDLLMEELSRFFKPEKVVFVIDEDGLYSSNPKCNKDAEFIKKASISDIEEKLSTSLDRHADVTGGMKGKLDSIRRIAEMGIDCYLINGKVKDRLYNLLIGNKDVKATLIKGVL
ncbi:MAG: isopentenyl phosphate kinase [Candidatus Thermoplasmatota archaeon]